MSDSVDANEREEQDYIDAGDKLKDMFDDHGGIPEMVFISDSEELQSYMMWWLMTAGITFQRHATRSYCEGFK
tara:strand:- start:1108 stop:1326 length:219 start_codon:yes stop_codon:yes gene_type:complete